MGVSSRQANFVTKELMKVLTTPSKIANVFDWKKQMGGALATLEVHADRIGVTIIRNNNSNSSSNKQEASVVSAATTTRVQTSYSFPIRPKGKQKIPDSSRQLLSAVVHKQKVCGMIVSWPIQPDTGLMGASCGRTLFVIEELLASSSLQQQQQQQQQMLSTPTQTESAVLSPIFTPNRKICLWDSRGRSSSSSKHSRMQQQQQHQDDEQKDQPLDTTNNDMDLFGRSAVYARTPPSTKKEYHASHEQYHPDESITIAKVWKDFMETNWPTMMYHAHQQQNVPNIQQQQQSQQAQAQQSMMESSSHDSSTNKEEQRQKKKDGNFHHHQQQQQRTALVAA